MADKIPDDVYTAKTLEQAGAKSALIITADKVEDLEFFYPYYRLTEMGFHVDVATPDGKFKGKMGYELPVTRKLTDVQAGDYDLLVLPGGKAPAELVKNDVALTLVKNFAATGRPIAAICHGPQLLAAAKVIEGRVIAGWPAIEDEITEAGATYVNDKAVTDGQFITARWPADLAPWMKAVTSKIDEIDNPAAGKAKGAPHLSA